MDEETRDKIWDEAFEYLNGDGVEVDQSRAASMFKTLADESDAGGMTMYGRCLLYGWGMEADPEEAVKWFIKAAEKDDSGAMKNLGNCYLFGDGVDEDLHKALDWFLKAIENGDTDSLQGAGICYDDLGEPDKAFEYYKRAADEGDSQGKRQVGICYFNGEGVERDYDQAFKWLKLATEDDDSLAWYALGLCYLKGLGTEQDNQKASDSLYRAAELGSEDAMREIVQNYDQVRRTPVIDLPDDADERSKEAWNVVEEEPRYAVKILSELGHKGHIPSCNHLATYYYSVIKPLDMELMNYWLMQASELGDEKAGCFVATNYECGMGLEQNDKKAFDWLQAMCRKNPDNLEARTKLALHYLDGDGVEKDTERGLVMLRLAAEEGHPYAQDRMGLVSLQILKDKDQAERWYRQAVAGGYDPAQKHLEELPGIWARIEQEKQRRARWDWLIARRNQLQNEAGSLKGLFANKRRREIEAELGQINAEIASMSKKQ